MRNAASKLTFIILTFNVTFINKLRGGHIKRRCIIYKPDSQGQSECPVVLDQSVFKVSWIKTTASALSYELGVNGGKKLMQTGILSVKMDIAHFTPVNGKPGHCSSLREVI